MSIPSQGAQSQLVQDMNTFKGANLVNDINVFQQFAPNTNGAQALPASLPATGFNPMGQPYTAQPSFMRDYINNLGAAPAGIIMHVQETKNPWAKIFKFGNAPSGGKVQTIHQNIIRSRNFGQGSADPFETNFGQITSRSFTWYLDKYSTNTYVDTQETMYFYNFAQINDFAYAKIRALIDGGIFDEWYHMKLAISIAGETLKVAFDVATDDVTLGQKIMMHAQNMQYFNTSYNEVGYMQAVDRKNIICIIPINTGLTLDWNVFSQRFNAELLQYPIEYVPFDVAPSINRLTVDHVITAQDVIDGFVDADPVGVGSGLHVGDTLTAGTMVRFGMPDSATEGGVIPPAGTSGWWDGTNLAACIMHRGFLKVIDALPATITVQPNRKKRYTNVFLNYKMLFMIDTILPAVFIFTQDPVVPLPDIASPVELGNIGIPTTVQPAMYGPSSDPTKNGPINEWGSQPKKGNTIFGASALAANAEISASAYEDSVIAGEIGTVAKTAAKSAKGTKK